LRDAIHLATMNVCKQELRNHVDSANYLPQLGDYNMVTARRRW